MNRLGSKLALLTSFLASGYAVGFRKTCAICTRFCNRFSRCINRHSYPLTPNQSGDPIKCRIPLFATRSLSKWLPLIIIILLLSYYYIFVPFKIVDYFWCARCAYLLHKRQIKLSFANTLLKAYFDNNTIILTWYYDKITEVKL